MLNKEIFDKIFIEHNLEAFNEFMEGFRAKVIEDTLCKLPEIMVALQVKTQGINKIFADFFAQNKDLEGRKAEVAELVQAIEVEDGSQTLEAILAKVPERMKQADALKSVSSIQDLDKTKEAFNGCL